MADFYTYFRRWGNTVHVREVIDGRRVMNKYKFEPTLYLPTNKESPPGSGGLFLCRDGENQAETTACSKPEIWAEVVSMVQDAWSRRSARTSSA